MTYDIELKKARKGYNCPYCSNYFNKRTYFLGSKTSWKCCIKCFPNVADRLIMDRKRDNLLKVKQIRELKRKITGKKIIQTNVIQQL
tara:strand:- start:1683 stop:1943 length:261 start_codon:yes stop_codon:yes gene_type:complete